MEPTLNFIYFLGMLHEGSSSDRPVRSTTRRIPTRRSPGDQVSYREKTQDDNHLAVPHQRWSVWVRHVSLDASRCQESTRDSEIATRLFTSISPVSEDPKVDYRSTVRLQVPDSVRKGFCFYRCIIVVLDFNTRLVPDEGRLVVRVSTVQRPRLPTICTPYVCYVFQLVVSQTEDTSSACSLSSLGSRSSLVSGEFWNSILENGWISEVWSSPPYILPWGSIVHSDWLPKSEIFRFEFVITIMDHKISSGRLISIRNHQIWSFRFNTLVLLVIRVTTVVTVVCKEGRVGDIWHQDYQTLGSSRSWLVDCFNNFWSLGEGNKGDTAVIGIVIKVYITCKMSFNIDCEQVSLLSTLNMGITGNLG